jgi:thiaminase
LAREKDIIILLERLLNQSRQDKIMYLNAADKQNLPTYKRFFNQQALYRNKMFNDYSAILSEYKIEVEEVLLKRPDIRQLMSTTIKREKHNPFNKFLSQDLLFLENLNALIDVDKNDKNQVIYHKQLLKITACIENNKYLSKEISTKEMIGLDLTDSGL